jgi:hypothetical protein
MTGSSRGDAEPNSSVFAAPPPRGVCAVTVILLARQSFTRDSRWK